MREQVTQARRWVIKIGSALLTADGRDELKQLARELGYHLLTKPVKPASLRAFLAAHHQTVTPDPARAGVSDQ